MWSQRGEFPTTYGSPASITRQKRDSTRTDSEYDGVEDVFVCHDGAWLFMLRD
jgi:hypothetical protein